MDTMDSVSLSCSARWWSSTASAVADVVDTDVVPAAVLLWESNSWDRNALVDAVSVGAGCWESAVAVPRGRRENDVVVPVACSSGPSDCHCAGGCGIDCDCVDELVVVIVVGVCRDDRVVWVGSGKMVDSPSSSSSSFSPPMYSPDLEPEL